LLLLNGMIKQNVSILSQLDVTYTSARSWAANRS